MSVVLLVVSLLSHIPVIEARDSLPLQNKIWVVQINRKERNASTGFLQGISDTALQLVRQPQAFGTTGFDEAITYHAIQTVAIHRKGSVGRGALYGSLSGAAVGGLISTATYSSCTNFCVITTAGSAFLAGALLGLIPGLLIGVGTGSRKRKFRIERQQKAFLQMRMTLSPERENRNF